MFAKIPVALLLWVHIVFVAHFQRNHAQLLRLHQHPQPKLSTNSNTEKMFFKVCTLTYEYADPTFCNATPPQHQVFNPKQGCSGVANWAGWKCDVQQRLNCKNEQHIHAVSADIGIGSRYGDAASVGCMLKYCRMLFDGQNARINKVLCNSTGDLFLEKGGGVEKGACLWFAGSTEHLIRKGLILHHAWLPFPMHNQPIGKRQFPMAGAQLQSKQILQQV